MGVDATIYIVASYSRNEWVFADATIGLRRNYDLWSKFDSLQSCGHVKRIQLMQASWCTASDGSRIVEPDCEAGYLFGDSYRPGKGFALYRVSDIDPAWADGTNGKILEFVRNTYADQNFLIIWH